MRYEPPEAAQQEGRDGKAKPQLQINQALVTIDDPSVLGVGGKLSFGLLSCECFVRVSPFWL